MTPPLAYRARLDTITKELEALADEVLDHDWGPAAPSSAQLNNAAAFVDGINRRWFRW